jgi:hypothetical protein
LQWSLPADLWNFIMTLKVGLEKASHTALCVHTKIYSRWITTGKDLHATDTLGSHQTLTGIMASTVWDGLAQLLSNTSNAVNVDLATTEIKQIQKEVDGL